MTKRRANLQRRHGSGLKVAAERGSGSNVITLNHCVRMMARDRARLSLAFSSASARWRIDLIITSSGVSPDAATLRSRFALARFGAFFFLPDPGFLPPRILILFQRVCASCCIRRDVKAGVCCIDKSDVAKFSPGVRAGTAEKIVLFDNHVRHDIIQRRSLVVLPLGQGDIP